MEIIDICKEAFLKGSNYSGETPTGVIREITYVKTLGQYMVTIELEHNGSKSHTDICFLELGGNTNYRVHSGKGVFLTKKSTALQKELEYRAIITDI